MRSSAMATMEALAGRAAPFSALTPKDETQVGAAVLWWSTRCAGARPPSVDAALQRLLVRA
jgi:hypothetical protein